MKEDLLVQRVEQLRLKIEKACVTRAVTKGLLLTPDNFEVVADRYAPMAAEEMVVALRATVSVPVEELQSRIIFRAPANLWAHLLKSLGLKHYHEHVLHLREFLVYTKYMDKINRFNAGVGVSYTVGEGND